ncbi:hypothetical protein [Aliidiomarina soli]|uniref:Uncharacterized protein n=1 Tax=Aliidiomarina soli TaxID=1928574 RepID=A0A432WM14_9GAMM|nr:hypothetical protein [Aliidiomarina soli]RUO34856.1 hypothetical protein CWE14_02335 [Aliidiomarina soli]
MDLGNWDSAVVKAVFITSLIAPVYFFFAAGSPSTFDQFTGYLMVVFFFYCVYLMQSVMGWAFVGFPVHWLITKYGNGRPYWYVVAVALLTVLMMIVLAHPVALIYGAAALIQAVLFRYYAYK